MDPQNSVSSLRGSDTASAVAVSLTPTPIAPFSARAAALMRKQLELIEQLAAAHDLPVTDLEAKKSGVHTTRVAEISALIAHFLALPDAEISLIRRAAPLHDLGKLVIPEEILLKPATLTEEEFDIIKTHTTLGERILLRSGAKSRLLTMAGEIARTHHEHWDGSGYPHGLSGTEIPLAGRIVAVADVYDALTRTRPYKSRWTREEAIRAIVQRRGSKFDPEIVDALLVLHDSGALDAVEQAVAN
jgi:putative two-component system response regulator